jgi:hypothetical protein
MLAALLVAFSVSAPATLTSAALPGAPIIDTETLAVSSPSSSTAPLSKQLLQVDPNSPDREPSFVDQYLSFQLSPMASQQTKDGLVLGHILGYVFWGLCGGLWGPVVSTKDGEFTGDVAISWFLSSVLWVVITGAVSLTGIGLVMLVALPYLQSTSTFNALDRGIKKKGLAGGPAKKPDAPTTPATPSTGETPPPSYAY